MMKHWWVLLLAGLVGVAFASGALQLSGGSPDVRVVMVSWWLTLTGILGIYAGVMQKMPRHAMGLDSRVRRADVVAGCLHCSRPRSRSPRSWD